MPTFFIQIGGPGNNDFGDSPGGNWIEDDFSAQDFGGGGFQSFGGAGGVGGPIRKGPSFGARTGPYNPGWLYIMFICFS